MGQKRGEIQVFSVSFLDVLSCALGGVLMLLMMVSQSSQEQIKEAKKENETLRSQVQGLVGLKGDLKNVVFVFDTSSSMGTDRYSHYLDHVVNQIRHLPMDNFAFVSFSDQSRVWSGSPRFVKGNSASFDAAEKHVRSLKPDGSTNTQDALQKALTFDGVDTVILYTDGAPSVGSGADAIRAWLKRHNGTKANPVVINTIALGPFNQRPEFVEFLQGVAHENGGSFQAVW